MKEQQSGGVTELFFRVFPPVAGTLLASILALAFYIGSNLVLVGGDTPLGYSRFQLFGIAFLAALFSNLIATAFLFLANADRYGPYFRSTLLHIFLVTSGLFALLSPLFLAVPPAFGFRLIQFCLPFSAIAAALILALSTSRQHPLLAAYQAIISGGLLFVISVMLFPDPIPVEMMPFFLMPIAWLIISVCAFIIDLIAARLPKPLEELAG